MGPLRYSIGLTLDGCCDHRAIPADEELHRHAIEALDQADALLFGRAVRQLKRESDKGLLTGGVTLPLSLSEHVDLKLMSLHEFGSGAMAMRCEPRR